MYGEIASDPAVKYYDVAFAAGAYSDIAWFVGEAVSVPSPVLDLGCGTGRIAIELARRGHTVTALDSSAGMLSILRSKLRAESEEVRSRVDIQQQPMAGFRLKKKFHSVVCCDAFFHNMTPEAERACLISVNGHLYSNGLLLLNIHNNPNPEFLAWASSKEATAPRKRGEYQLPDDAGTLQVFESTFHDPLDQTVETKFHFRRLGPNGQIMEETDSAWSSRYMCRFELLHLLELCGFKVEGTYGGYLGEPVTVSSQLVLRCRMTRSVLRASGES